MKIDFTKLELQVIDHDLELAYLDRKPKYQKAIAKAQSKISKLGIEFNQEID
jgi:hypothetical protein